MKLFIPEKIKVGFGKRDEELAFVIPFENGKWRQEESWNSWRGKKEPLELDNKPFRATIGEKSHQGWNHYRRNTYVRCMDSRGFKIEISVENLLFLIDSSKIKDREVEEEVVYGWDGKNIVLIPTNTQEYKDSISFTKNRSQKISLKDLEVGGVYTDSRNDEYIYLGRLKTYPSHVYGVFKDGISYDGYNNFSNWKFVGTSTYKLKDGTSHVWYDIKYNKFSFNIGPKRYTRKIEVEDQIEKYGDSVFGSKIVDLDVVSYKTKYWDKYNGIVTWKKDDGYIYQTKIKSNGYHSNLTKEKINITTLEKTDSDVSTEKINRLIINTKDLTYTGVL